MGHKTCFDAYRLTGIDFDCCTTCHNDEAEGHYDLNEVEWRGHTYYVCCSVSQALKGHIAQFPKESTNG
jgi:hypothetical protein